jgi:hypothetical protein
VATILVFENEVTANVVVSKTTVGSGVFFGSKLVPMMVTVFVDPYAIVTLSILGIWASSGEAARKMAASTTANRHTP